jgi:uncharacterized membrane protein
MIPVEAHLLLNHIPVIGLLFGVAFLVIGVVRDSPFATRTGLHTFVAVGVIGIAVGASGLLAANILADAQWLDPKAVGTHRLAGILTLVLLVALACSSGSVLFSLRHRPTCSRAVTRALLGLATIALGAALWTAYLGGHLRHTELSGIADRTWLVSGILEDRPAA